MKEQRLEINSMTNTTARLEKDLLQTKVKLDYAEQHIEESAEKYANEKRQFQATIIEQQADITDRDANINEMYTDRHRMDNEHEKELMKIKNDLNFELQDIKLQLRD